MLKVLALPMTSTLSELSLEQLLAGGVFDLPPPCGKLIGASLEQQTAKPDSSLADEPEVEDVDSAHIHQAQAEHSWILK